jgi:hypothetical protein
LAGFEAALCFVDHVDAAFAAHNATITVPVFQRTERVFDFHSLILRVAARALRLGLRASQQAGTVKFMVGTTRFELVTPSMSTKCSTTELSAHECFVYLTKDPPKINWTRGFPTSGSWRIKGCVVGFKRF